MWNAPTPEDLAKIPKLLSTDGTPFAEKIIYEHFFLGGSDWYVAEFDGDDTFFGFAILNGDYDMAEWGNFSLQELKAINVGPGFEIDRDLHWQVRPAKEVGKIKT